MQLSQKLSTSIKFHFLIDFLHSKFYPNFLTTPEIRQNKERLTTISFFENLSRISKSDYVPTVEDVLRIRVKTSGITELDFPVGSDRFV